MDRQRSLNSTLTTPHFLTWFKWQHFLASWFLCLGYLQLFSKSLGVLFYFCALLSSGGIWLCKHRKGQMKWLWRLMKFTKACAAGPIWRGKFQSNLKTLWTLGFADKGASVSRVKMGRQGSCGRVTERLIWISSGGPQKKGLNTWIMAQHFPSFGPQI